MENSSSVSKGCFAYKGKKKRIRPADYFRGSGKSGHEQRCLDVYQQMWEQVDTEIQILQSDLNTKIFDDLVGFIQKCHPGFTLDFAEFSQLTSHDLPTAALLTGVNTPDHAVMFSNLVSQVRDRVTPHVAILRSKDCGSLSHALSKLLVQILHDPNMLLDEDEEDVQGRVHQPNTKKLPCCLSTLAEWYKEKYLTRHTSPKKRRSANGSAQECVHYPPVVVVFEDLESFLPKLLQDFIMICSNYLLTLPFVFVFGIATSVSAVHRLLPNSVSSILCMEKFQAPPSTEYLTLVMNQIVMTEKFPFKLGSKVFSLLWDIFLFHDFSVLNFIKGLQFSMMDHYYGNALSSLCCLPSDLPNQMKKLTSQDVRALRKLPSLNKYLKQTEEDVGDDRKLLITVERLIKDIHKYHEDFFPVLNVLHTLVNKLPGHPLGKQLRETYALALADNVFTSQEYKEAMSLLRMMSKDDLILLMTSCREKIEDSFPSSLKHTQDTLLAFIKRIDTIHEVVEEDEKVEVTSPILKRTSLHDLKQQLQEMEKKKKKQSPYEKLRSEVMDFFDEFFRQHLRSPNNFPLYELMYYDSVSEVRYHLYASPRSALQTALGNPSHYLQTGEAQGTGSIRSDMPDICIVYMLHLECSQLINMYDWLQAFVTVVTANDEDAEDKIQNPDTIMQARFIRAVSELQFLGFIKPTKRKTDHVARLTWGGC